MEKEGNSVPTDASEDGEHGTEVNTIDELQGNTSNPTPSPNLGETSIQNEAEFIDQNGENTNELDKRIRDMIAKLDEMGPTISRYQYDEASNEVQRLASDMKEKAMATMIHHLQLEDAKTKPKSQKEQILPRHGAIQSNKKLSPTFLEMEIKLKELEKQSNKVARRIKEYKREQAHTMEKLQILEARALLDEKKDFIKDILTRVPTETDLQNLETIRLMLMERKSAESRIQALNMRASALDKAMGAVAKSKWFEGKQVLPRCIRPLTLSEINSGVSNHDINTGCDSRDITASINSSEINSGIDSREINSGIDSIDTGVSSREIQINVSSGEIHKKKQLLDFTQMPAAKRDSFLAKHFSRRTSSDLQNGQTRLSFLNSKKTRQGVLEAGEEEEPSDHPQKGGSEDRDNGSGKSEHSGVTIVTMNSDDRDVDDSGRQQTSEPGTAVDLGESRVTDEVTRRSPEPGPREHENPSGKGTE